MVKISFQPAVAGAKADKASATASAAAPAPAAAEILLTPARVREKRGWEAPKAGRAPQGRTALREWAGVRGAVLGWKRSGSFPG